MSALAQKLVRTTTRRALARFELDLAGLFNERYLLIDLVLLYEDFPSTIIKCDEEIVEVGIDGRVRSFRIPAGGFILARHSDKLSYGDMRSYRIDTLSIASGRALGPIVESTIPLSFVCVDDNAVSACSALTSLGPEVQLQVWTRGHAGSVATIYQPGVIHSRPQFSRDGSRVAFVAEKCDDEGYERTVSIYRYHWPTRTLEASLELTFNNCRNVQHAFSEDLRTVALHWVADCLGGGSSIDSGAWGLRNVGGDGGAAALCELRHFPYLDHRTEWSHRRVFASESLRLALIIPRNSREDPKSLVPAHVAVFDLKRGKRLLAITATPAAIREEVGATLIVLAVDFTADVSTMIVLRGVREVTEPVPYHRQRHYRSLQLLYYDLDLLANQEGEQREIPLDVYAHVPESPCFRVVDLPMLTSVSPPSLIYAHN